MLRAGEVRSRPPRSRSQAHPGVHPLSPLTHRTQRFQPLPPPLGEPPYHYSLEAALPRISAKAAKDGEITFHLAGDTGGVKNADCQRDVAAAIKGDLLGSNPPSFFYHLGDVVYYNGQIGDYYDQFYEPYDQYSPPIISIPGNHDGDPADASQTSLDGWVRYFMSPSAQVLPESKDAPRATMSLPNVYFTLDGPFVTIIGMYTNVPEHGSIDSQQQQWLTNEFAEAPTDKALVLALHHPIYSFDDHHSGSPNMADAVQQAINDSRRVPNMILTAHVHNYQRIERPIANATTPFLVVGHGGYFHLHGLNANNGDADPDTHAKLIYGDDHQHGYATITVTKKNITGTMSLVASTKRKADPAADKFSYPAGVIELPKNAVVNL